MDETESDDYIYNLAGLWPLAFGGSQRRSNNNNNNNLAGLDEYNNDDNLDAFYNEMMDETESDDNIYNLAGHWPLAFGGSQRRGNNNNNNNLAGLDEYNDDDNLDAFYNEMMGETESE